MQKGPISKSIHRRNDYQSLQQKETVSKRVIQYVTKHSGRNHFFQLQSINHYNPISLAYMVAAAPGPSFLRAFAAVHIALAPSFGRAGYIYFRITCPALSLGTRFSGPTGRIGPWQWKCRPLRSRRLIYPRAQGRTQSSAHDLTLQSAIPARLILHRWPARPDTYPVTEGRKKYMPAGGEHSSPRAIVSV